MSNVEHALSRKKEGFIIITCDQIRDTASNLLKMICNDVKIEPPLLSLSDESLSEITANIQDSTRGFWFAQRKAFLKVRLSNPSSKRYREKNLEK